MLKSLSNFFSFNTPSFVFSQKNVFIHACATPLTILMSNLEEEAVADRPQNRDRSKVSLKAVTRLSKIIKSVAGNQDFNEKFKICNAINEVLSLMRNKIEDDCFESKIFIEKDLFLVGNRLYFQEALTCILNNSIEAYKEIDCKPVSFIVRKGKNCLKIDIIDYASGMNLILQKLSLLRGVTTKKNGMGLGLYFAKKTVEDIFSGKMRMISSVGLGTRIALIIPLKKPCNQSLLLS